MILVTGATGSVGGAVLRELLARGAGPVRAVYRDAKDRPALPGGVEAVRADFSDPPSLDAALAGVESAYLVCAAVPQLVELESAFLHACAKARTPHVVVQSALGAADFEKSFPAWHRQVERLAEALRVPHTVLRPNGFMQNIAAFFAPSVRAQDAFYDALGPAKISYIDVRDVAAAAARALLSPDLIGQTFELSGPEAVGTEDLARRISKAAGRPVRGVDLSPEQMKQGMIAAGMPESRATPVVELYDYYRSGRGEASDAVLRTLIDGPPRTIDAYLAENASIFAK